jgi:DNA-directed RNA polymerase sigma subunit (sigma70/sigma32)
MATALLPSQSIHRQRSTSVEHNIVRAYLRQIGRIPRLTPEEEITLGHQVQQMMGLLEAKTQLQQTIKAEPTQAQWAEAVHLTTAELERILQRPAAGLLHRPHQQICWVPLRFTQPTILPKKCPLEFFPNLNE